MTGSIVPEALRRDLQDLRGLGTRGRVALVVSGAAHVALVVAVLRDLARRPTAQVRGPKRLWRLAAFVNYVGPVAYLLVGRRR